MYVFIWNDIEKLTNRGHTNGGLVVVAESPERAIELANARGVVFSVEELWPDTSYRIQLGPNIDEAVFIHPNAGCS